MSFQKSIILRCFQKMLRPTTKNYSNPAFFKPSLDYTHSNRLDVLILELLFLFNLEKNWLRYSWFSEFQIFEKFRKSVTFYISIVLDWILAGNNESSSEN